MPTSTVIKESHRKIEDRILSTQDRTDVVNVVTPNMEKGSGVLQVSTIVIFAKRLVISIACATRKKDKYNHKKTYGSPKAHQLKLGSMYAKDPLSSPVMLGKQRRFILLEVKGAIIKSI